MKSILKNKTILMMGAPGTGKGSYSKLLSKRFGIPVYSSGEHLRDIIKQPKEIYNKQLIDQISDKFKISNVPEYLENILSKGGLISKEIMSALIIFTLERTKQSESNSIILDGYPRTLIQAQEFDLEYKRVIDLVLNIEQDNDIIIKKLLGRRSCSQCPAAYNVTDINEKGYVMPSIKPKVDGVCDRCGGKLELRSDDNSDTINERLKTYEAKSLDMYDYFNKKGTLVSCEMKRGFDDIKLLYDIVEKKLINNH